MNLDLLSYLFGFELSFLIVGLAVVRAFSIPLKKSLPLYLLLAAAKSILAYLAGRESEITSIIIVAGVGLALVLLMTGMLGDSMSADNYSSIAVGVGLFPWYLNTGISIAYFAMALIFLTCVTEFRIHRAFTSIGHSRMTLSTARKKLSESDYEILKKNGSTIFAVPIMVAGILAMTLMYFS